jgi:hypothetical protein
MAQPLYRQLLVQARRLARLDARRPQQGNPRRAVSGGYYALFHFLIDEATRFLLGTTTARRRFRNVLARAFIHTEMASVARTFAGGALPPALDRRLGPLPVPAPLRELAEQFILAQDERHAADYDLARSFMRDDVTHFVERIEQVIAGWRGVRRDPAAEFFLLSLLVWTRIRER